jgi:hypothetical protein
MKATEEIQNLVNLGRRIPVGNFDITSPVTVPLGNLVEGSTLTVEDNVTEHLECDSVD